MDFGFKLGKQFLKSYTVNTFFYYKLGYCYCLASFLTIQVDTKLSDTQIIDSNKKENRNNQS